MNETPFKFTSEEKEQTLQILERLRTAVGDTFKPGDEQHLREDIQHAFINHQIKRNVFGMNPILAALQTAEIAVNEIGLKRDGIIAILMQTSVIDGYQTIEEIQKKYGDSKVLSSDVSAAFDPNFPSVMTKRNTAYFGKGLVFNKFTGSRGKSGSNDANAEYLAKIRGVMDDADVSYQFAELGKVDAGGGGTIAYIMANYGMEVIDSGVAVLSMHAPWEVTSKADVYEAYKGYVAFLKNM